MTRVRRLCRWLPFGWVREITRGDRPYLARYSLRRQYPDPKRRDNGGWRVYIHRFVDGDDELHNHPWHWSFSLIVRGSYCEAIADMRDDGTAGPTTVREVRWFNWISKRRLHRILPHPDMAQRPVWTLFVAGPRHNEGWGFYVRGRGVVNHTKRKKERGV